MMTTMMMTMTEAEIEALDPGIRDVVVFLREHGFDTFDSGDGVSKEPDAIYIPYPHVFMRVAPEQIVDESKRLYALLPLIPGGPWEVEGSYAPKDGNAFVLLTSSPPYEHPGIGHEEDSCPK